MISSSKHSGLIRMIRARGFIIAGSSVTVSRPSTIYRSPIPKFCPTRHSERITDHRFTTIPGSIDLVKREIQGVEELLDEEPDSRCSSTLARLNGLTDVAHIRQGVSIRWSTTRSYLNRSSRQTRPTARNRYETRQISSMESV